MYADATIATSVHARGASKLSATAEAINIAATAPTIVKNSEVLNDDFVSSRVTRRAKDVVGQAKTRASELPDELMSRVRETSQRPATRNGSRSRSQTSSARKQSSSRPRGSARKSGAGRKTSSAR
jgi:hypothetical protein